MAGWVGNGPNTVVVVGHDVQARPVDGGNGADKRAALGDGNRRSAGTQWAPTWVLSDLWELPGRVSGSRAPGNSN